MDNIPEILRMKMCLDSIILQKNEKGWKEIHKKLTKVLYLKTTNNIFDAHFKFEHIFRFIGSIHFYGKPYTWLKKATTGNMYWYTPYHLKNNMNDLFSTDSEGYFIDDYGDY